MQLYSIGDTFTGSTTTNLTLALSPFNSALRSLTASGSVVSSSPVSTKIKAPPIYPVVVTAL